MHMISFVVKVLCHLVELEIHSSEPCIELRYFRRVIIKNLQIGRFKEGQEKQKGKDTSSVARE
jgi:hypothetical protein